MDRKSSLFPDDVTLRNGLAYVLGTNETSPDSPGISVLERNYNEHSSTYPSEVVTCQMLDGRELILHCKYSEFMEQRGHRKGICHEAQVYNNLLQYSTSATPKYYGTYRDAEAHSTWLILEHINDALSVSKDDNGILLAAQWLGLFHKASSNHIVTSSFLDRYDASYFLKWSRQAATFIAQYPNQFAWLTTLCEQYEGLIDLLLSREQTIIHGEFYPSNILIRGDCVYPIDWESTAIAAGELDLAALTEGWPTEITDQCINEYKIHRWPEGAPSGFFETLSVARISWHLRWLGDNPYWLKGNREPWRLEDLREKGEQLGLI